MISFFKIGSALTGRLVLKRTDMFSTCVPYTTYDSFPPFCTAQPLRSKIL